MSAMDSPNPSPEKKSGDKAAKLKKSLGNVRDFFSVSVCSRENQNISSSGEMNYNCAANFQDATADLHTAERVLIPEEQVNTLNEENTYFSRRSCSSFGAREHARGRIY